MTAVKEPCGERQRDAVEGADGALAAAEDAHEIVELDHRVRGVGSRREGRPGCGGGVHDTTVPAQGGGVGGEPGRPAVRLSLPGRRP